MAESSSKKASVPEAKEAMSRFKEEVASELGVPFKTLYTSCMCMEILCRKMTKICFGIADNLWNYTQKQI